MKKPPAKNVAASVRERLYQLAARRNEDFALVLTRYALERLLYRLSLSEHRDRLILKGAMLFHAWTETPHRPTRDLDLLGFGEPSQDRCREMLRDICSIPDTSDGLIFAVDSLTAEAIKEDDIYHGVRIRLTANLAQARVPIQIDIGFGDFISPAPQEIDYPTLLEMPAPRIRAYSMESVIAEKTEAMLSLGILNSRMKDFYDVWFLARTFTFEAATLRAAIMGTFARRQTTWSNASIYDLLAKLGTNSAKQIQWRAFVTRSRLQAPEEFRSILESIRSFSKAEGKFLHNRIDYLVSSGKLPESLKEVAHGLKDLRNFGAHGNLGDLDPKDAPLLESLCRALLMYFYTVPALSADAKKRLGKA